MWNSIGAIFTFLGRALGLITQRDAEKNAPDVKAAQAAQNEVNAQSKTETAIKSGDLNEIRNETAE